MTSFLKLADKEIIDVQSGRRLGYADDVEFDEGTLRVKRIVIFGKNRLFGLGGKEENTVIEWDCIKTIGEDIILVEASPGVHRAAGKNPPLDI